MLMRHTRNAISRSHNTVARNSLKFSLFRRRVTVKSEARGEICAFGENIPTQSSEFDEKSSTLALESSTFVDKVETCLEISRLWPQNTNAKSRF